MTRYTTKPQTVEAMQWLGPDDPAHVAEFEAWATHELEIIVIRYDGTLDSDTPHGRFMCFKGQYVIREPGGSFAALPADQFESRYTPTPDVEAAP